MSSKKLTKKQKAELQYLRLKQDPLGEAKRLAESLVKRHGKGFKRTRQEWENSIADHIGKIIDNLTMDDMIRISVGLYGALALRHPFGFLWGSIGYQLTKSPSTLVAGSGLATLAILGLAGIPQEVWQSIYEESLPEKPEWYPDLYKEFGLPRFR
jgi:hypothetical protein